MMQLRVSAVKKMHVVISNITKKRCRGRFHTSAAQSVSWITSRSLILSLLLKFELNYPRQGGCVFTVVE